MQELIAHMETNHQYKFECTECKVKFPSNNALKKHKKQIHPVQPHQVHNTHSQQVDQAPPQQHQNTGLETNEVENQEIKCPRCNNIVHGQNELITHINQVHKPTSQNKCKNCNKDFESREDLAKHIDNYHTKRIQRTIEKPQWTCHFCKVQLYSQDAKENHICVNHHFKSVEQQTRELQRKNTECRWGASCSRWPQDRCWFNHSRQMNTTPQIVQPPSYSRQERPQLYCKFQERCTRKESCNFKHFNQDFLQRHQEVIQE